MKNLNVDSSKAVTAEDFKELDAFIDAETKRKLEVVPEAKSFNVMTACIVDGEFNLVSEYSVPEDIFENLKNA